MTIPDYLKGQLTDFVDAYQKFFKKTFSFTVTLTLICFVIAAFFLHFSKFDTTVERRQISLLSYFFNRYSKNETFSIVDLVKSTFIFFVALFSVGLTRLTTNTTNENELSFKQFINKIKIKDFSVLLGVLGITFLLDYLLFKTDTYSENKFDKYIHGLIFHLRIYVPIILFAFAIRSLAISDKTKITFKRILLLYISIWLFNEFAFEISLWVRAHLFKLILLPFSSSEYYYVFESFLGIPLIAFYFLGYHSAMTTSLRLTEQK